MAHLTALKRSASLTDLQLIAWHAALGVFDAETVNAAVLEMALTEVRFPEVGDLYQICRRRAIAAGKIVIGYSPMGGTSDSKIPKQSELREIANRFGLKID